MTVWIVSASHRWIIEAGADYLHVPRSNVIPISSRVKDGRITDEAIMPVPFQAGKVDAIHARISDPPITAFSDSINDLPMLEIASKLRVVISPDDQLRAIAVFTWMEYSIIQNRPLIRPGLPTPA